MNHTLFSHEAMKDFFECFDSTQSKYFFQQPCQVWINNKYSHSQLANPNNNVDLLIDIREYESMYRSDTLLRRDYGEIADRQMLVFSSSEEVNENIYLFEVVRQKILEEYLAIPNLEELFSERYFDFEWDMLVGRNFPEAKHDYYRDHFIHQIRNLFMMFDLLNSHGFYEPVKKALCNTAQSAVAKYFCQKRKACVETILTHSLSKKTDLILRASGKTKAQYEEAVDDYVTHYAIYAATAMAALFHDIGYPVRHYMSIRDRVAEYMPAIYTLGVNSDDSNERIFTILGQSLLFHVVKPKELRERLKVTKTGDYDHGAYSAITFLAALYDNGSIFDLSDEQRLAVELAAVMIYDHTKKYKELDGDNEPRAWDYRELFHISPLSFLFRVCDDLQEWKRIYYEISDFGELAVCPVCGLPMVRFNKDGEEKCVCGCKQVMEHKQEQKQTLLLNPHIANARMIYPITTCDEVRVDQGKNGEITVMLDYDLEKLLYMCVISSTYAKYRLKELNKLKQYMAYQSIESIPSIKLDYFMSYNPVAIKLEIMVRFLVKKGKVSVKSNLNSSSFDKLLSRKKSADIRDLLQVFFDPDLLSTLSPRQLHNVRFYMLCGMLVTKYQGEEIDSDNMQMEPEMENLLKFNRETDIEQLKLLVNDALKKVHAKLKIEQWNYLEDRSTSVFEAYTKLFKSEDADMLLHITNEYCNPVYAYDKNYEPLSGIDEKNKDDKSPILDFYSDLEFFHNLWKSIS